MVIVKLKGGLGNQFFQYAAAKQIALNNNAELMIDSISGFKNDPYNREFSLNEFSITSRSVGQMYEKKLFNKNRFYRKVYLFFQNIIPLNYRSYIKETQSDFDPKLKNLVLNNNVYLEGYFQSHLYFDSIAESIKKEFIYSGILNHNVKDSLAEINQCESVSIHLRSFNIDEKNDTSRINGICTQDYYEKAILLINSILTQPIFYIFSDNQDWAKKYLNINNFKIEFRFITYIDTLDHSFDDFILMSSCKYNIIANSTFSWWAAWLNKNVDKIVISPSTWLASEPVLCEYIYPKDWYII